MSTDWVVDEIFLESGTYRVYVGGGEYDTEISWSFGDSGEQVIARATPPSHARDPPRSVHDSSLERVHKPMLAHI